MSFPKILVVEDEKKVAALIKRGLEENGFLIDIVYDGLIAKQIAINEDYDLIILDLNLPGLNGYEVCKEIRNTKQAVPILMLTALSSVDDKIMGFDSGADDYLAKPFDFKELLARVRSLLKRSKHSNFTTKSLKIANLELDTEMKVVRRNNKKIVLTAKEYTLLEFLLRNKGRVISRAEIAEKVWDITFDTGTNVIDVYINFLRRKIDKDYEPKLIHTQIGLGYYIGENE